jgi:DNA-binding PadR family transcriptional regulator
MRGHFWGIDEYWDRLVHGGGGREHGHHSHACGGREHGGFDFVPGGREEGGDRGGFGGRGRGGFDRGFGNRDRGGFGRGFGGRRERLFDAGDVKLVLLKLLSEQPSYGYQLMKTMEERLSGGYTPSAGVIYPTLTMLEEEGLAAASLENNKKVYSVTAEGTEYLAANQTRLEDLFARMEEAGRGFKRGRSPEIMKAFMNLRRAVVGRVSRNKLTSKELRQIADAIDVAAKAIDEL